ncbi:thiamine pyrophosphate-dependent enzyme, partial [Chloroflexota bacterium]
CPIERAGRQLIEVGITTAEGLENIEEQVLARIEEAVRFAMESPFPEPESALDDVFCVSATIRQEAS